MTRKTQMLPIGGIWVSLPYERESKVGNKSEEKDF